MDQETVRPPGLLEAGRLTLHGAESLALRLADLHDFVEAANVEYLADRVGEGTDPEFHVLPFEGFCDQENYPKPGTADVGELLHIQDDGVVSVLYDRLQGFLKLPGIGAINAAFSLCDQSIAFFHGINIHLMCLFQIGVWGLLLWAGPGHVF